MPPPTTQPPPPQRAPATTRNDEMPSTAELYQIAGKSLQTGALTGAMGVLIGAGSGIMRSAPPALFALVAGIQWFALGSSYMASRSLLWHAWGGEPNLKPMDKVQASAVAGGVSGMIGGLVRGPRNILPGILFFSALGGGTTYMSQKFQSTEPKEKTSLLASKWSPLKPLTEKEYEKILEERILRLDAEIAVIDDHIAALKAQKDPETKAKEVSSTSAK